MRTRMGFLALAVASLLACSKAKEKPKESDGRIRASEDAPLLAVPGGAVIAEAGEGTVFAGTCKEGEDHCRIQLADGRTAWVGRGYVTVVDPKTPIGTPTPPPYAGTTPRDPSKCRYATYYEWNADGARKKEKEIVASDLGGCRLTELALLRNEIFARAGNPFRKKWLRDHFSKEPWYKPTEIDPKKLTPIDVKNAATVAQAEVDIPRAELERRLEEEQSTHLADLREVSFLSIALGKAPVFMELRSPLEDPSRLDQLLTVDELADFSPRDLRILRNTIYARRGRPFKSPILREYFSRMEWYAEDPKYTDARLTKTDLENVKIVSSVEKSLGGPVGDADHADMDQCA